MSFYIYAWAAAISSGFMLVIEKLTSKYSISNPWLLNFFVSFFLFLFTIPFALSQKAGIPNSLHDIIFAGFFGALFSIFYFFALYKFDVSILSPLLNLRGIFGVLLGIVFLGEILTLSQIFFIIVIVIAGIFVTIDEKFRLSSFFKPSIMLIILGTFALALNGFYINRSSIKMTYWELTFWLSFMNQLFLLTTIPFFIKDLRKLNKKQILTTVFIAFIFFIYNLTANKAFSVNVGITSVIVSLPISMIMAFVFSVFAPKLLEKHTLKVYLVRFIAAGVIIFASLHL